MPFIAIALVIAAALGGGTAAVAQNSLPGDALWGFKVQVNEGLQGALSTSESARANWDINAIQTRIDEAQALAAKGTLSTQSEAKIDANFNEHTESVLAIIDSLQAHGDAQAAADVAAKFQAAMADRAAVLAEANASAKTDVAAKLAPIALKVRALLDQASNIFADVSTKAQTNTQAETSLSGSEDSTKNDTDVNTSAGVKVDVDAGLSI